jgi:O-methyltransferase
MNHEHLQDFAPEQLKAIRNDLINLQKSLTSKDRELIEQLAGYSMLPPSRLLDAYRASNQASRRSPNAAVIEFGVYRGGALAAIAYGALLSGCFEGAVLGFDTFEGHTEAPLSHEIDLHGNSQRIIFDDKLTTQSSWAACDANSVLRNYRSISESLGVYLPEPSLIKGNACITASELSQLCPNGISLLRLDMDWYEPTKAALNAATPMLCRNAIIIADDYGHHSGVRESIDEWLADIKCDYDYTMTDYSCMRILLL